MLETMQASAWLKLAAAGLALAAGIAAWQLVPSGTLSNPEPLREMLVGAARGPWAPVAVVGLFAVASLVMFPVTVLIAVTGAVFGPAWGLAYSAAGVLTSALVGFALGAWLGKDLVRRLLGPRLDKIREQVVAQGVLAVAAIRLLPVAPFTVVNLVAGASGVRTTDFAFGSALGLAPGLLALSGLGYGLFEIIADPTPASIAALVLGAAAWLGASFLIQRWVSRRRG